MKRTRLKTWQIPVTPVLDQALENAVAENAHVSKSDYVRDAVREKLARDGHLPLRKSDRQLGNQFGHVLSARKADRIFGEA